MMAHEIAVALGGAHPSGAWWRCPCPVHGSHGATLALRDGDRGLIVKCFAGCSFRDILAELRCRGLLAGYSGYSRPALATARGNDRDDPARRIEIARKIWGAARDAHGTPAARYLAARGITIPLPPSLRWAPVLRRRDGTHGPAMVARIDGPDGEFAGVHRTWLDRGPDGTWRRRNRAMLGCAGGGAVRLASAAATLLIGEGVETCVAAMQACELPAWAALSTSGMKALVLPDVVLRIIILADNDVNGTGERAARAAANRWVAAGQRVRIVMPPKPGTDMADLLAGRAYGEVCDAAP
jgi:hypothetical protein